MKILIVEDDFVSRRVLQAILSPYGVCDIAVNGEESVDAFKRALKENEPYHLICMDIMMPGMDGQQALKEIRHIEEEQKVRERHDTVIIIMVTVLEDFENIMESFKNQCEAYILKPIEEKKLLEKLRELGLISNGHPSK